MLFYKKFINIYDGVGVMNGVAWYNKVSLKQSECVYEVKNAINYSIYYSYASSTSFIGCGYLCI